MLIFLLFKEVMQEIINTFLATNIFVPHVITVYSFCKEYTRLEKLIDIGIALLPRLESYNGRRLIAKQYSIL